MASRILIQLEHQKTIREISYEEMDEESKHPNAWGAQIVYVPGVNNVDATPCAFTISCYSKGHWKHYKVSDMPVDFQMYLLMEGVS